MQFQFIKSSAIGLVRDVDFLLWYWLDKNGMEEDQIIPQKTLITLKALLEEVAEAESQGVPKVSEAAQYWFEAPYCLRVELLDLVNTMLTDVDFEAEDVSLIEL